MSVRSQYEFFDDAAIYGSESAECVDDPRKQLEELEAQILRTEELLAQLVQKRVPLKRKINSRFAPVLQLPLEISSEIFSSCFPSNSWGLWHSKTPLALGEVCSAWRDLAWSMPWLWSTVSLDIRQCSAIHAVLLSEWLGRTAELPLSIHLRLVCDILTPPEVRSAAHLLDVLALYSERWCHIDFDIPFFFPNGIRSKGPVAFPLLRNMSLRVMGAGSQVEAFRLSPNLRTVCLKGFIPGSVALPLSQITHIRLGPTTADECLNILGGTPNLTHCIFEDILRSDVVNPSPITARRLESFKVISSTRTPLSEILDAVSMPAIREFEFNITGNAFPHWSFISLVSRSSMPVERLVLTGIRISERHLWECFRAVPSVVHLELTGLDPYVAEGALRMLNPICIGDNSPCILPNLSTLIFSGGISDFSTLIAMLSTRSRRGPSTIPKESPLVARLQSAVIKTRMTNTSDGGSMAELRLLMAEGFDLSLLLQDSETAIPL